MNVICNKYLDKIVLDFIDDMLVYSNTKEKHEEHLEMVSQVLKEHQLYPKLSKCDFFKIKYNIWATISEKRVAISSKKIKAIMDFPLPQNVLEVRSFMVLEIYYLMFVQGFSKIGHLITSLQRK